MERYFMVKQKTYQGSPWHAGRSFMKTNNGQFEFLGGDNDYLGLIFLNGGEVPTISKRAVLRYEVTEIKEKETLDLLMKKNEESKILHKPKVRFIR